MKKVFIIIFITSQLVCYSQNNIRPFVNPIETAPRFTEDIGLSEAQNKKLFNKRILSLFTKHFNYSDSLFINNSIKTKAYIMFSIDSLGKAKFYGVKPKKIVSIYHIKEVSRIIDSLPKFIPAKQRNRPVKIGYSIPILLKKIFFKPQIKKTSQVLKPVRSCLNFKRLTKYFVKIREIRVSKNDSLF